jgi:flagellar motor switch protein FliN/FliY
MDLVLQVSIELGRTKMYVKDILELERGSIIELDKMAGEPVDLYINEKKMAVGEVVVVDKHFGIRITNLIDPQDRIKNLGKDL